MLFRSGRRAFARDSAAETMHAILRDDPADLTETVKGLAPSLDRIVAHCLEKSPDERFQSARDVAFNLESLSTLSGSRSSGAVSPVLTGNRRRVALYAALVAAGALVGGLADSLLVKAPPKVKVPSVSRPIASSLADETASSTACPSPRARDSWPSRRVVKISLGWPRQAAPYTTVCPSGAKRARPS